MVFLKECCHADNRADKSLISKEMKYIRIIAMAVATMGIIHIAATFTPLINGGLEVLSPAKQQAMTYMSLMCGMLLIVCGLLIAMLHEKVKEHPFLLRPYMLIYGALSVDGISAVAFMPHNPFAWLVLIFVGSLVIHATYSISAASHHHIKSR